MQGAAWAERGGVSAGPYGLPSPASIPSRRDTDASPLSALHVSFLPHPEQLPLTGKRHFAKSMVLELGRPGPMQVCQFPHLQKPLEVAELGFAAPCEPGMGLMKARVLPTSAPGGISVAVLSELQ